MLIQDAAAGTVDVAAVEEDATSLLSDVVVIRAPIHADGAASAEIAGVVTAAATAVVEEEAADSVGEAVAGSADAVVDSVDVAVDSVGVADVEAAAADPATGTAHAAR